ncbi:ferritin family protein [Haloimpatiens sp. FM7315]|uniref:ferritin family protein n=1 Tax=Haloimpatiens sp. FM7315 TaxID=3298609 RepID=UPI003977C6E4
MKAFNKSVDIIKRAIEGEKEDEAFYNTLIEMAPTKEQKEIIESIRDDEIRHNIMFKKMYAELAGMQNRHKYEVCTRKSMPYIDGIKKALFGEMKAVEEYREILKGLPNMCYRDIVFDIITDEIKHGIKYNYILYLNCLENKREDKSHGNLEEMYRNADCLMCQNIPEEFIL